MELRIIKNLDELKRIEKKWKELEDGSNVKYYSTFNYLKYWIEEVVNKNNELFIVILEKNTELLSVAPLYIEKRKTKIGEIRELKFIGVGDYFDIIISENGKSNLYFKEIFSFIEKNRDRFDRINLSYIEFQSKLANYILSNDKLNNSLNYLVEVPELDFSEIYKLNDINISKNMKNYKNRLLRDAKYNFEILIGNQIDEKIFADISDIHQKEQDFLNKEKNRTSRYSILSDDFKGDIYSKLIIDNENVVIFLLKNENEEIIVYKICYLYDDIYYEWNTGYNYKYYDYRPNNTLYIETFKYLINKEFKGIYDFGAGRYPWKYRWANKNNIVYEYDEFVSLNLKIKLFNKLRKLKDII
ncbi:GNAT family N-acetyltransferase [Miniphocaeibacter massiliensis]|uniref:GNAT family N-acetyltransferase n=1 Tax=Miniphocaeibacter massiliensis TaxID=2041841 RepID=UPI000C1C1008|nr:GNAT family N-acetyltransferase [Miniphocaeibacter massiliensis]